MLDQKTLFSKTVEALHWVQREEDCIRVMERNGVNPGKWRDIVAAEDKKVGEMINQYSQNYADFWEDYNDEYLP